MAYNSGNKGANATSQRVDLATLPNNTDVAIPTIGGHSIPFELYPANANRKELIVLNHGTIGSLHLYYGGSIPLTGEFISPIELFYHDTWASDIFTGIIWAQWHEPEEKITTPVAVTLTSATDLVTRTAHGLVNHSEVLFNSIVTTTGIIINTIYYAIRVDANTFKLATTKANVRSNTPIDLLTGNGSGTITHSLALTGFINATEITT